MKKIFCAALLVLFIGATVAYSGTAVQFRGLIINSSESSIEIKMGRKEVTLYWTDSSKVLKNGKEAGRNAVEICQKVKATYANKDGRKELAILDIQKDSYCKK